MGANSNIAKPATIVKTVIKGVIFFTLSMPKIFPLPKLSPINGKRERLKGVEIKVCEMIIILDAAEKNATSRVVCTIPKMMMFVVVYKLMTTPEKKMVFSRHKTLKTSAKPIL